MSHSTNGGTPFAEDDFTWALEPLELGACEGGACDMGAWDAALVEALVGPPPPANSGRQASSRCRIRGCAASLTAGYSQRAKLCEAHLHAQVVPLPDTGAPGRFCQRCHKLQPLAAFSGSKRTCDAALASFNKKRRAQHSQQAAGAKAEAAGSAMVMACPLRETHDAVPASLEATLRERLGNFIACTAAMRQSLAAAAPALTPEEARKLHFCLPPMANAVAQMAADGALLTAECAALTPEQAAHTPAWSAPAVPAAQRAEQYVMILTTWAVRAACLVEEQGVPPTDAAGRALVAPMQPCVDAMNALLAHTQAALALLRLESRGRYLAGAALACELGAALMRRAEEICHERGAWLTSNLQLGAPPPCAPQLAARSFD